MIDLHVKSSKGQLKIQQIAFVLVAFILLFGLVLTFYVSIRLSSLREDVNQLRHEQAQTLVLRLAGSPEFSWTVDDCASCIDLDKTFILSNRSATYRSLWGSNLALLRIQRVYPGVTKETECSSSNYPDCTRITLVETDSDYTTDESFVALCRVDEQSGARTCTLGKIIMGVTSA